MRPFRRTRRGVEASLGDGERMLLRNLARDLTRLLDHDVAPGADPVLTRLLPDAYRDDAEAAREFRSLTEDDLRASKRAAAAVLRESVEGPGGPVVLDDETAEIWLLALNDLRLAIGTRVGIEEDTFDRLERGDVEATEEEMAAYGVYELLSVLQDSLVHALAG